MPIALRTETLEVPVKILKIRDAATQHTVLVGYVRDTSGASRLFYEAFGIYCDPNTASGSSMGSTIVTSAVTTVPTNGTSPISYSWAQTSGDSGMSALNPTSATTYFQASGVGTGGSKSGVFTCTATDANGLHATATVTVYAQNTNSS